MNSMLSEKRMHDRWLDPPDGPKPVDHCDLCDAEIYEGEKVYYIDGKTVCEECYTYGDFDSSVVESIAEKYEPDWDLMCQE